MTPNKDIRENNSDSKLIDCHIHLWELTNLQRSWNPPQILRHTFLASDLDGASKSLSLNGCILIESGTTSDDEKSLWKLAQPDTISAVITYLEVTDTDLESQLDIWEEQTKFRGVRIRLEGHPNPECILGSQAQANLSLLVSRKKIVELLVTTDNLPTVLSLANKIPELGFVIDHMGKPDLIDGNDDKDWQEHMTLIAQNTNGYTKLSISPRADQIEKVASPTFKWDADAVKSKVELLLEKFGPHRLMWGSDWPISRLTDNYQRTHEIMTLALQNSSSKDRNLIFFSTAKRFYSL